ncbi:hypothetical protein [Culicoidibacter larvae]|uniref:Uncharacterized protein n=1 Tax=Culicoidibacter larvae TaxID=2579976 RepID=A0A5R8Q941_9FIRM|nr:hypothetical protein [Culicoidibacter larvae]TLG71765.1 hypothetical protein FEZ08_10170 [Culicoidibacter larvae]
MYTTDAHPYKAIAGLSLAIAIISSIMIVPVLGLFLDALFAIPSIAVFVLSIISIVIRRKNDVSTLPVVFSVMTGGLGIFATMLMLFGVFGDQAETMLNMGSQIFVNFIYVIVALAAWCGYVVSAILNYRNFYLLRKTVLSEQVVSSQV